MNTVQTDSLEHLRAIVELLRAMTEDLSALTDTLEQREAEREQIYEEWA